MLEAVFENFLRELQGAPSVHDDLDGLETGEFIEEPATTGVHEQGVALHFEKLKGARLLFASELMRGVMGEVGGEACRRAIENYVDVCVASSPGIFEELGSFSLVGCCEIVAQGVEGSTQWSAPVLRPSRLHARVTAAIAAPALNAVRTTPRGVIDDFDFVCGRMLFKIFAVVGELGEIVGLDVLHGIRERHLAVAMVMAVGLAICRDVHQLRPITSVGEATEDSLGEVLTIPQESFKGDCLGNRAVVKEEIDDSSRRKLA